MLNPNQEEVLYDGKFLRVIHAENGHEIVQVSNSVAIVVYVENTDEFVIAKEYRTAIKKMNYSLVAGRLDKGLGVVETAVEELKEEAGIIKEPQFLFPLLGGVPQALSPGVLNEVTYGLYAIVKSSEVDWSKTYGNADEGEVITLEGWKRRELLDPDFASNSETAIMTAFLSNFLLFKDYYLDQAAGVNFAWEEIGKDERNERP